MQQLNMTQNVLKHSHVHTVFPTSIISDFRIVETYTSKYCQRYGSNSRGNGNDRSTQCDKKSDCKSSYMYGKGRTALSDMSFYNDSEIELSSIPEREWRLLAALAMKRSEENERQRLADHYRCMWLQEKEERKQLEAQSSLQYQRLIERKREEERSFHDYRRMLKVLDEQTQQEQLLNSIKRKDRRTEELLACKADKMATGLCSRAWEEESRAFLAAERRALQESKAMWRKLIEVEETRRKCAEAERKRENHLRVYSSRLQLSSVLSRWDTLLHRDEIAAADETRRAQYAMLASLAEEKGTRVTRAQELMKRRARAMAAQCEVWRDEIRRSTYCMRR